MTFRCANDVTPERRGIFETWGKFRNDLGIVHFELRWLWKFSQEMLNFDMVMERHTRCRSNNGDL